MAEVAVAAEKPVDAEALAGRDADAGTPVDVAGDAGLAEVDEPADVTATPAEAFPVDAEEADVDGVDEPADVNEAPVEADAEEADTAANVTGRGDGADDSADMTEVPTGAEGHVTQEGDVAAVAEGHVTNEADLEGDAEATAGGEVPVEVAPNVTEEGDMEDGVEADELVAEDDAAPAVDDAAA